MKDTKIKDVRFDRNAPEFVCHGYYVLVSKLDAIDEFLGISVTVGSFGPRKYLIVHNPLHHKIKSLYGPWRQITSVSMSI